MSSRRTAKVAEAIREQVSTTILFGLKDPRVKNVTVTGVEVSSDLRNAKVYVSVMGDEKMQRLTLHGLQSARGFIQAKIAEGIQLRYTPILQFHLDQGIKRSIEASRILREVLPQPANDESLEDKSDDDDFEDDFEAEATTESGPRADEEDRDVVADAAVAEHSQPENRQPDFKRPQLHLPESTDRNITP